MCVKQISTCPKRSDSKGTGFWIKSHSYFFFLTRRWKQTCFISSSVQPLYITAKTVLVHCSLVLQMWSAGESFIWQTDKCPPRPDLKYSAVSVHHGSNAINLTLTHLSKAFIQTNYSSRPHQHPHILPVTGLSLHASSHMAPFHPSTQQGIVFNQLFATVGRQCLSFSWARSWGYKPHWLSCEQGSHCLDYCQTHYCGA